MTPPSMEKAGLFYVQKEGLVVNASFGVTQLTLRCSGATCPDQINAFEDTVRKALGA